MYPECRREKTSSLSTQGHDREGLCAKKKSSHEPTPIFPSIVPNTMLQSFCVNGEFRDLQQKKRRQLQASNKIIYEIVKLHLKKQIHDYMHTFISAPSQCQIVTPNNLARRFFLNTAASVRCTKIVDTFSLLRQKWLAVALMVAHC